MIEKLFVDTEEEIKRIQSEAAIKIKECQHSALERTKELFESVGWDNWTIEQLVAPGQYERCLRAFEGKKMKLVSVNHSDNSGVVQGSSDYTVSASGCSCSDFLQRKLPCKHMYYFLINKDTEIPYESYKKVESAIEKPLSDDVKLPLSDIIVVLSGTFSDFSEEEIIRTVNKSGGKVSSSISKRTSFLVVGENPGTKKIEKAEQLGVKIISLEKLLEFSNGR